MFFLIFLKMPTNQITSRPEYLEEVTNLQSLIADVKNALMLINNTLYENLSTDKDGAIDRSDINIGNISANVENAVARLMKVIKNNATPALQAEQPPKKTPPSINGLDSRDRVRLTQILEEFKSFLHNFIARNKIDILHSTARTAIELETAQDNLEMLQKRGVVEEAFDANFSKRLDIDWNTTLANLSLALAKYEQRIKEVFEPNAEDLMIISDEATLTQKISEDAEQSTSIQKQIQRKDAIASFLPVKIATRLYSYFSGKLLLPWSSPERQTRETLEQRIQKYSDYVQKRRSIIDRRNRNS